MPPRDFDLVVAGGGPGGTTAASLARSRGFSVVLIEKEQFPRFKIGESLLPNGNEILRETGVWPKLCAAGFIRKLGATFHLSNGRASKRINFSENLVGNENYAFQVERARFDSILLDHARELGAEVELRTRVTAIEPAGGLQNVRLEGPNGPRTVTARWVIDASGREGGDLFPEKRPLDPSPFPKRVAIYSHFHGVARAPGPEGGDTIAVRWDHGWFWVIPIDAERTSVGLVTTVSALRESGLAPEAYFNRVVADAAKLREIFDGAVPTMPFRVTGDYSYFRKNLASRRILLVGDAAGFFDPIFSSGVYMSMWSARLAVGLMVRADAEERGLTARERRTYSLAVKRHAGVFQQLIDAFYHNDSFAVFMSDGPWGIEAAICSIVAGHAKLSWKLWWRFRFFLAICWLQKRQFKVCPPLDYSLTSRQPA
jgi:flavin-dependent dehydrogenase